MTANSIERIDPDELNEADTTGLASYRIHAERYQFATKHCCSGRILDIACGVGYGSPTLAASDAVQEVVGVDIDSAALSIAAARYQSEKTGFERADALTYFPSDRFDAVVSLETVEHLDFPVQFIQRVADVYLRKRGTFVTSVPVTPSVDFNPYHRMDFTPSSFRRMVENAGFVVTHELLQVQPYNPISVLLRREGRMQDARRSVPRFSAQNPSKLTPRLRSLLVDGFSNKYLTLACRKS
jgi:SAM-dependent methyltransferase